MALHLFRTKPVESIGEAEGDVAGVVAVLAALCYAELASSVPTAGSAYSYAFATAGELVAWIIGWDLFLEFALGAAVVARGWSGYVGNLLHLPTSLFGEESAVDVGAVLIVVVLTAAAVVFFSYTGFEAVANLSEETRPPGRDLPLGLLGTLALSTVLYVGVSFVVVGMVKYTEIDEGAPIADAFDQNGLPLASAPVSLAAVAGLTSVILVDLVTVSRIGFAMGRDGLLPPAIARVSPRTGTPVRMTLLYAAVVLVMAAFVKLQTLADLVSIGTLFAFVLVSIAVPVLRRTKPDLERKFRLPWSPVVPALSALACLSLMVNLSVQTWLRFLAWTVLGLVVCFSYGHRHSRMPADVLAERRPALQTPPEPRPEHSSHPATVGRRA